MKYKRKSDENLIKCAKCGKYKVDTLEDFELTYKEDGTRVWYCETCNKYKKVFKNYGSDLALIIEPKEDSEDCTVYSRDMYI